MEVKSDEQRDLYLSNATIIDYITNIVQNELNIDDIQTKFTAAISHREDWETGAEIGRKIMLGDFSFMQQGILGAERKDESATKIKLWSINFLETNINTNIAHFISKSVDIKINNDTGSNQIAQILLEQECNFAAKRFSILRKSDACIYDQKYTGMGYAYCGWDPYNIDRNWLNGKPEYHRIEPFNVFLDPNCRAKDKSDRRFEFVTALYSVEDLKRMYPDKADEIEESVGDKVRTKNIYAEGLTAVAMYNFKYIHRVKKRPLVNEDTKKMIFVLEHELEDYLTDGSPDASKIDKNAMDALKTRAGEDEANEIFDEKISVGDPIESNSEGWYSLKFIPGTSVILEEPQFIGVKDNIEILPGNWDPDSPYSYGDAYKYRDLLEADVLLMTTLMLDTVKKNKPLVLIREGAIKNFTEVIDNWGDPNLVIIPDAEWELNHVGVKGIEIIEMPRADQMQVLLSEKLQLATDKGLQSPNVVKGIPDYAQQPAKGIMALQSSAVEGAKADYEEYKEFTRGTFESLRYNIALNRTYEHTIWGIDPETRAMGEIKVNDPENPETMLFDVIDTCWVQVEIDESNAQKDFIKEQKMTGLFQQGSITYEDYMRSINLDNAESLIENKKKQDANMQILDLLNNNPEFRQMFLQAAQNNGLLGGEGQEEQPRMVSGQEGQPDAQQAQEA